MTRQPAVWAGVTAVLAALGGQKGRRAALRGSTCYLIGAAVGNLPKPLFGRPQPRQRRAKKPQVVRGSFPSGHNAAEVAYVFGAAQEAPSAFVPLSAMALVGHWSLLRAGKHYLSDTIVGGFMGLGVVAAVAKAWRPRRPMILELPDRPTGASRTPKPELPPAASR
ncbi:MAG: phosphatase PAP2 family protein [Actinomycetota bacterium]|nr:phosphatase PAP2 family protein [Actinomycetota bacterium]